MKKVLIVLVAISLSSGLLLASAPAEKKNFIGEWKFESPHAPEGYQNGKFVILEKDGVLAGEIVFSDQYKVEMKDMAVAGDSLKFGINVEYEYIAIKAAIENGKMKGSAASPDGDLPFEAVKVAKK